MEEIKLYEGKDFKDFLEHVNVQRKPAILRGIDIGPCVDIWSPEYLGEKVGNMPVKVHVSPNPKMDFIKKNFSYKTLPFDELVKRASRNVQDDYFIHPQELYYLRSLGTEPRGTDVAVFEEHYPSLSDDLKIPEMFGKEKFFSSILRVSSPQLCLWTHYDVMDNVLIQIRGKKKIYLFDPVDALNLYLIGDKSQITDPNDTENPHFPNFKKAKRYETTLIPGDIIFIPALWLHNVEPVEFSVAVNVFWRNLDKKFYDQKDTYGNKDPIPAARALQTLHNAMKSLDSLPEDYQHFYYTRMISEIFRKIEDIEQKRTNL
ncbi:hypothetical protein J437_LFUL000687 [Ladona fulva]|uniref:tRNA wybutosine-synthesizing protein 4 n=1 Tax=Ladona fulva TaxID=123851 RepID=A0A8K0NZL8_LADFU|nr:hypothetical protein J437_LFUL000687 [Ladona fulva]